MRFKQVSLYLFLAFLVGYTAVFLGGVSKVPFHPDESTFLYLSSDFELLFTDPLSMAWQPETSDPVRQKYRTLDAPLGRYMVGMGRFLAGLDALPVDWDWGMSWEENRHAGALPSERLLLAGRLAAASLVPLAVLLLFLTGRRLANERAAWITALLLAGSALVLLHTRRAMSEGLVVFTASLFLWSLVKAEKRPWLAAIAAALAFSAKHSLIALAPVGLLAVLWQPGATRGKVLKHALLYCALYALVVVLLNPFLWAHPVQAAQDALSNRQDIVQRQVSDRPSQEMKSPAVRLVGMLGQLFLVQPMIAETGNYLEETRAQEQAYFSNPLHTLLRSPAAGAVLLLAYLYGHLAPVLAALKHRRLPRRETLLVAASLVQAIALLVTVQLPFQRYYLPLVPHVCLWAAYGMNRLLEIRSSAASTGNKPVTMGTS